MHNHRWRRFHRSVGRLLVWSLLPSQKVIRESKMNQNCVSWNINQGGGIGKINYHDAHSAIFTVLVSISDWKDGEVDDNSFNLNSAINIIDIFNRLRESFSSMDMKPRFISVETIKLTSMLRYICETYCSKLSNFSLSSRNVGIWVIIVMGSKWPNRIANFSAFELRNREFMFKLSNRSTTRRTFFVSESSLKGGLPKLESKGILLTHLAWTVDATIELP